MFEIWQSKPRGKFTGENQVQRLQLTGKGPFTYPPQQRARGEHDMDRVTHLIPRGLGHPHAPPLLLCGRGLLFLLGAAVVLVVAGVVILLLLLIGVVGVGDALGGESDHDAVGQVFTVDTLGEVGLSFQSLCRSDAGRTRTGRRRRTVGVASV